jgi:ribosomal protein L37E
MTKKKNPGETAPLPPLSEPLHDETQPAMPALNEPPALSEGAATRPPLDAGPESAAYARLCSLIQAAYHEKQAADIIAAFDAAFTAAPDETGRRVLLDYWTDFYRLHAYRQRRQRRRSKPGERVLPCSACGYPSSHRHHLWAIETHGENAVTIQLCANCHELNHLMYNALVRESDYSRDIVRHVMASGQVSPDVLGRVLGWTLATIRYEADNGWIEGARGSREHVEARLAWSAFIAASSRP